MSDGKPCTFCKVGWMVLERVQDARGVWYRIYYCDACGKSELSGANEKATVGEQAPK